MEEENKIIKLIQTLENRGLSVPGVNPIDTAIAIIGSGVLPKPQYKEIKSYSVGDVVEIEHPTHVNLVVGRVIEKNAWGLIVSTGYGEVTVQDKKKIRLR